ncbi:unnamed protein product, partial [Toxocara canis]|uniref:Transposase n=1 Tax=Toxocara canis TaxID=6265 RepID=A0A183VCK8_TOXCA
MRALFLSSGAYRIKCHLKTKKGTAEQRERQKFAADVHSSIHRYRWYSRSKAQEENERYRNRRSSLV